MAKHVAGISTVCSIGMVHHEHVAPNSTLEGRQAFMPAQEGLKQNLKSHQKSSEVIGADEAIPSVLTNRGNQPALLLESSRRAAERARSLPILKGKEAGSCRQSAQLQSRPRY